MPRVRLDLTDEAFQLLTRLAVQERRPIDWQAEVLIESGLGIRCHPPAQEAPVRPEASERLAGKAAVDGPA